MLESNLELKIWRKIKVQSGVKERETLELKRERAEEMFSLPSSAYL